MSTFKMPPGLSGDSRNAYVAVTSLLTQWGLGSLAGQVLNLVKEGYDAPTTQYLLTQTNEYKKRFAGNDIRVKNGLDPLSPAEYIATEAGFKEALRVNGMPKGFYDKPEDFTNWIGMGVSPAEVNRRAQGASQFLDQTDPNYRQYLANQYGWDAGHLAAHFLDQKVAEPILQKRAAAAMIGGAASDYGLQDPNHYRAETWADRGITADQAQRGYADIARLLPNEQNIANRFGTTYTQADAEREVFSGSASAARKRKLLNEQEGALFSADSGVQHGANGTGSLSPTGAGSY